jgi:pimeloyl-ACP methyl ester carboxylesterase
MDPPDTRYAKTKDGVHIAYQVVGDGPIDLIFVPGFVSNVEYPWQQPALARFLRRLASFTRLIVFDKRGTGLSDRVPNDRLPGLETRMDDIRAVMDVAGAEHAVLFGASEGTALCALFGATYPERTDALVLYGSYARETWAADYPWSTTTEEWPLVKDIEASWGTTTLADILIPDVAPSEIGDDQFRNWFATYIYARRRQSGSSRHPVTDEPRHRCPGDPCDRARSDPGPAPDARPVGKPRRGALYG